MRFLINGGGLAHWLDFAADRFLPPMPALLAAPFTFVALTNPNKPVYLSAIVIAEVLIFMSTGPVNSAIVSA